MRLGETWPPVIETWKKRCLVESRLDLAKYCTIKTLSTGCKSTI